MIKIGEYLPTGVSKHSFLDSIGNGMEINGEAFSRILSWLVCLAKLDIHIIEADLYDSENRVI